MKRALFAAVTTVWLFGCGRVGYDAGDAGDAFPCDGCMDASTMLPASCGDGVRGGSEQCDDGNAVAGDGCESDCTSSCEDDSSCDDDAICNGVEICDLASHACRGGAPLLDGVDCGGTRVCRGGACALASCGNGIVDPGEECDDDNAEDGDGCDNDCSFSCAVDATCSDGDACNGTEICDPVDHVCESSAPAATGSLCDRDGDAATRDICLRGGCALSVCGDDFVDDAEGCDDGNLVDGDGCEADCTPTMVVVDSGPLDADAMLPDAGGGDADADAADSAAGDAAVSCGGGCPAGNYCCGDCGGTLPGFCLSDFLSCMVICGDSSTM